MRWHALRPRDRRALLLAAAILTPALGWRFAGAPYTRALGELTGRAAHQRDLLRRELALLAEAPAYPALMREADAALRIESQRLFSGTDPFAAAASLADYVARAAETQRVLVQSSETRPARDVAEGLLGIEIQLRGMSDLEGIIGLLHALERSQQLIRIEQLVIRQEPRDPRARDDEEVLTLTAVIGSLMAAPGGRGR